jgi:hypothetical protein
MPGQNTHVNAKAFFENRRMDVFKNRCKADAGRTHKKLEKIT